MAGKKTLEQYQIEEIASEVIDKRLGSLSQNFVQRGEYDIYIVKNDNAVTSQGKEIGVLQAAETERQKDKKTVKYQIIGIALGFVAQFIVWAIVASNGFKVGG